LLRVAQVGWWERYQAARQQDPPLTRER
jgi:hypothetical protein